jgi:gliding motility-associated-like protein
MRQLTLALGVLFILLLSTYTAFAQISASETEGCAPLASVQFTNAFNNPTGITWNFGDGGSSNLPNPVKSYAIAGVYTVTFTATVNGNTVTDELIITVFANPTAQFSVNPAGLCLGDPFSFTDESTGGSGTAITNWQWDYGNGTAGSFGANPNYTYPNAGSYQVTLIVTDENSCEGSTTVAGAAVVSTPPNVNVTTTPNPPAACEAPLTVAFINNSTSNSPTGGGLTFDWDLGNGTTSTAETPPLVTYTENGFYTVTVTATDNVGCTATQTITVTVQEPEAEISVVGGENGVVCANVQIEIEGSTGGIFNYGDGTTGFNTSHTYLEEGEYTIEYSVNVAGCFTEASTTITVEIPQATMVSNPGFSCSKPVDFNFDLESTYDIVDFAWNFPGEPSSSTDPNPTVIFDYTGPNEYGINGLFTFASTVSFTTSNGCTGTAFSIDSIALPNALMYPDADQGCAPLDVEFTNESTYLFNDNLASAEWHYGDGTVETTGPEDDTDRTYTSPGEYDAYVILTTTEGCIDTSFFHNIEVGEELNPSFTVSPEDICRDDSVTLTNTSVDIDLIDAYSYSADLNTLSSCIAEESPTFAFNDFAGTTIITQSVDYNGCISTSEVTVQVSGPVGHIAYGCNCDTPFDLTFTAEVFDADSWTWDFGDGTVVDNSTSLMTSHTYSETGDYEAILTTFNDGTTCGSHADTVLVKVRDLSASLQIDSLICAGVQLSVNATELQDVAGSNGGCYRNYLWDFGDNTRPIKTLGPTTNHIFQNGGDFTVTLSVKDDNECVFTTTSEIRAFSVQADYEADTLYGCLPLEVNFIDLSAGDTTIVSWEWDFDLNGDGSDDENPTYTYDDVVFDGNNNPIPYVVTLLVTDALGCVDEISTLIIELLVPNPEFINTTSNQLCAGESISFQPTGTNINFHTYEWDFGNGTTSEESTGNSVYNEGGTYTVTMVVTDSIGCFREEVQEIVFVQDFPIPLIATNFDEDESLCYPFQASYTNASVNDAPAGIVWELDQVGTITNQESVGTTYLDPGFYDVSLSVSTTFGCESDTMITVEVEGPLAEIGLNPNAICPGGDIELTLNDTADLAFWQFDFGDGNIENDEWITQHTYEPSFIPTSGSTILTLIMYSADSACTAARTVNLIIEEVIADFERNNEFSVLDSIHCFGTEDQFTSISSPNASDFFWTISNGQEFNTPNVSTTLPPGDFEVELIVNSALGCADTLSKNMTIFSLPEPTSSEGEICQGETVELMATGGVSYAWSPTTGLDDANAQTVQASPETSVNYTVTVTDENDCVATTQSFVLVYQPPPSISVDTILRIGDTDIAGLNLGGGFTYQWTPDIELECDTCPTTLFRPLEDREYTLTISDTVGCFSTESYFFFEILEVASVVVPDAFTPNGDGVNDIIYVEGWGIEELISFQIYNRWGELIFETADENEGWDGSYKGEVQNPDSYAYVVVAKNFIFGNPETFKGFIDLVK